MPQLVISCVSNRRESLKIKTYLMLDIDIFIGLNPGLNNISTLLNTVAPNVTLSRTNLPPDSQLMLQQQLSPGQRNAPFSPQSNPGRFSSLKH